MRCTHSWRVEHGWNQMKKNEIFLSNIYLYGAIILIKILLSANLLNKKLGLLEDKKRVSR
jgi:hypothetical protein